MSSENLIKKSDGATYVFEKSVMCGEGDNTVLNQYVYDAAGHKTGQVEIFKKSIERVLKTIKLDELFPGGAYVPRSEPVPAAEAEAPAEEEASDE